MTIDIEKFVRESNLIEGILRDPTGIIPEIAAHELLITLPTVTVSDLCNFVNVIAPGHLLRNKTGVDVRVGSHYPPPGGIMVEALLEKLLTEDERFVFPFTYHRTYETLHPFTDGNGRSGRALWLRQMLRRGWKCRSGFLQTFYYQALANGDNS